MHRVDYQTLVADLLRLLSADEARRLQRMRQDPLHAPAEMMLAVLEAFPAGEPVVVLLGQPAYSAMDAERVNPGLRAGAARRADRGAHRPAHAVTAIATTG